MRTLVLLFVIACVVACGVEDRNLPPIAGEYTITASRCRGAPAGHLTLLLKDETTISGSQQTHSLGSCTAIDGTVEGTINDDTVVLVFPYSDISKDVITARYNGTSILGTGVATPGTAPKNEFDFAATR